MLRHRQTRFRRDIRNIVVSINTCNFLDQIFFDRNIKAPAWYISNPAAFSGCNLQTKAGQNIDYFGIIKCDTNQFSQLFTTQCYSFSSRQRIRSRLINYRTTSTTANFQQQGCSAFHRFVLNLWVNTALKAVAWVALALVIGLAGSYLWRTPSPAPVAASTTASSPQTESAPAVVTLGADAQALDPLQREAWAKYLLASYHLESADDDHWTLILADQDAGVIEAELSGWDDETIELSGRVDSNVTETVDGEDWDVYRVKLLGPADLVLDIRFKFSESATAGEGTLIGQGDHQEFKILSSTDL